MEQELKEVGSAQAGEQTSASQAVSKFSIQQRRRNGRKRMFFHAGLFLAALAALLVCGAPHAVHLADSGAVLVSILLLYAVRAVPILSTQERPLTFTSPVVFGLSLWLGPAVAAWSALLSHLLRARFGVRGQAVQAFTLFQGGQLALAALASGSLYKSLNHPIPPTPAGVAEAFTAPFFAALLYLGITLALTLLFPPLLSRKKSERRNSSTSRVLLLTYSAGMLPILLVAPLGERYGPVICLPVGLLLLLSALALRLTTEVNNLQRQLRITEEMGRAGIAGEEPASSEDLLRNFLELSSELVSSERAMVWLLDEETHELRPSVGLPDFGPFEGRVYQIGEGLIGHAALRVRPRLSIDVSRDIHRGQHERASGSWLLYPIVVHHQVLGVAHWTRPVSTPFTLEDIACLDNLTPQITITLENLIIRSRLREQALTDGLTGLWNHRQMMQLLRDEVQRAGRYHHTFSVLMLDVDSFKSFNDTYGHPQGDRLLRSIAAILRASVRNVDNVGRYGGEEFLILLPETPKDDACRLAERIRGAVAEYGCVLNDGTIVRRTISVGVSSYPEDALNAAELLERADEALYRAKRSGKNCVIWA